MAFKKVGVLWTKEDKKQRKYLAGKIDLGIGGSVSVMIFEATKKKSEKSPDYTIQLAD
jgi:uncharacterized protein (DUF736 family)